MSAGKLWWPRSIVTVLDFECGVTEDQIFTCHSVSYCYGCNTVSSSPIVVQMERPALQKIRLVSEKLISFPFVYSVGCGLETGCCEVENVMALNIIEF